MGQRQNRRDTNKKVSFIARVGKTVSWLVNQPGGQAASQQAGQSFSRSVMQIDSQ